MIPYWLKPNKVGVALFVVFVILFLYLFSFFGIIIVNHPLLLIAFSVLVAYPISMFLGMKERMKILSVFIPSFSGLAIVSFLIVSSML